MAQRVQFILRLSAFCALCAACMAGSDFYEILGVPRDASTRVIKKAYHRLARLYHPDKHPGNKSMEEKFKSISKAYEVLADDQQRQKYDQFGEDGINGQAGHQEYHGGFPGGGGSSFHMTFDEGMFSEVFGDFGSSFGGGSFGGFGGQRRQARNKICNQNKICENGRCYMVKECKS